MKVDLVRPRYRLEIIQETRISPVLETVMQCEICAKRMQPVGHRDHRGDPDATAHQIGYCG